MGRRKHAEEKNQTSKSKGGEGWNGKGSERKHNGRNNVGENGKGCMRQAGSAAQPHGTWKRLQCYSR